LNFTLVSDEFFGKSFLLAAKILAIAKPARGVDLLVFHYFG